MKHLQYYFEQYLSIVLAVLLSFLLAACNSPEENYKHELAKKNAKLKILLSKGLEYKDAQALNYYNSLLQLADSFEDYPTKSLTILYNRLSMTYYAMDNCPEALNAGLKALEVAHDIKANVHPDSANLDNVYFNLAMAYRLCRNLEKYKTTLDSSLLYGAPDDFELKAIIYHGYTDFFSKSFDIDSIIPYAALARANYEKIENDFEINRINLNLAGAYYDLGRVQEGLMLTDTIVKKMRESNTPRAYTYLLWAKGLVLNNDLNKAALVIDTAMRLANIEDANEERMQALEWYRKLLEKKGDYKAMAVVHDSITALNRRIFYENQISSNKQLEESFLVKEQKNKVTELSLKNQATRAKLEFRTTFSVLLLIVALVSIFSVYQYWQLQKQKEQAQRIAVEQKLFGAQINPHFIFNALSAIQAEVLNQNTKKANLYLTRFGRLMQSILTSTTQEYISIGNEYKNLINYLELQKFRFENFDYEINTYEEIEEDDSLVPPMLIQPLLENAVEHGWASSPKGIISLKIERKDKTIICTVLDSGVGLNQPKHRTDKISVSTSLIKKRLAYLSKKHKVEASLSIQNRTDSTGVKVTIVLPLIEKC